MAPNPVMLAYRAEDNKTIQYAPAPSSMLPTSKPYDSDGEPLIAPEPSELDEEALMNFTATGRPIQGFKPSALQNLGGHMFVPPQLLPKQYTDDSIIPAIVTNVTPAEKPEGRERRKSFLGRLRGKKEDGEAGLVKVVYMPRREYKKYFARGLKGEYIGSEPERQWSESELEETFGKYKPETSGKKRPHFPAV